MGTTAKGAPFPDGGDPPDGPADIQALAEWTDDRPGISLLTYAEINALAGADLWAGRRVYQSNTGTNRAQTGDYVYNGVNWRAGWNMAWGLVAGPTSHTGGATTYAGYTNIPSLPITFSAVGNRYYKVTLTVPWHNSTPGEGAQVKVTDSTAGVLKTVDSAPNSATDGEAVLVWVGTLAAGSHTLTPAMAHAAAGTVTITNPSGPAQLWIEDLGPSGAAT